MDKREMLVVDGGVTLAELLGRLDDLGLPVIAGGTDTEFLTGDAATVQKWSARLWVELPRVIYWNRFMRENDMNAIIEVRSDLEKGPGDKLTFTLLRKLTGAGVTGDTTMEGSEEAFTTYNE